jgi:uncharacterized protein (TIGR02217 family)
MQQNLHQPHCAAVFHSGDVLTSTHGGPTFATDIATNAGGFEQRNANYRHALGRWELGNRGYCQSTVAYIQTFFRQRRGQYQSFLWRDLADYTATAVPLALADYPAVSTRGVVEMVGSGVGQLAKWYQDGTFTADRYVYAPVPGSVVGLPAGMTLDYANGSVAAPGYRAGIFPVEFEFYTPVRFDVAALDITLAASEGLPSLAAQQSGAHEAIWFVGSLPLVEVRL